MFLTFFVGLTSLVFSQPYNNSWINYSQQYYKFKVAETGIYRIDSTVLANSGIPLSSINPANFQLFARGVEVPLYIQGEGDGTFDGTDFIEFYGQYNDGWLDENLYGGATNHPNPYYSLFNDTICYYLTWNSLTTNNRLTLETDTNFSVYTPINYFNKEAVEYYTSGHSAGQAGYVYYDGQTFGKALSMGYVPTEGWFDDWYTIGANKSKSISTANAYTLGPNAIMSAVILGESDFAGLTLDQHLRISLGANQFDSIFSGYQKIDAQMSIPIVDLGATTTSINFESVNDLGSSAAKQAISYIKVKYPHTLDMEGLTTVDNLYVELHPTELKSYLNFNNFNATGNVIFYEITNGKRIDVVSAGGIHKCLVPNTIASEVECFIGSDGEVKSITNLVPVGGTGSFVDFSTVAIDTAFVIITHSSLMTEANDYAAYRSSGLGSKPNPQNPIIFNIDDLYDQFAYGVEKHPFSIRNFIDYISDVWPSQPNYLFLLGKAIKPSQSRKDAANFKNNLVPSFGDPASDNMLSSGLNGTVNEPLIPTGRIAAKTGTDITWYLNKIIDYENPLQPISYPFDENKWMKRVLHFGGGSTSNEQGSIIYYLNNYETTIEDTLFGGDVHSFLKNSTAPIQITLADTIKDYIENGVALMTFYGHSSAAGGFDQNIDDVNLWPNQNGKYPFMLGLGCHAGDIHMAAANSTSEDYVIFNDKGVIGYLSSVGTETISDLNVFAREFHNNLAYSNYGGSVGGHIKNTNMQQIGVNQRTAAGMTLHGDPSLVINSFDKPDYMIEAPTVTFNPSVVTSDIDSFDINVLVTNLGRAVNDIVVLEVIRNFPGTSFTDTIYTSVFPCNNYQQTISFTMPVDIVRGLGLNEFTITIDAANAVTESFENNNVVTTSLNILSGEIIPVYPYEFMIVPDTFLELTTLKASTAFPFEPAKDYIFEIDTTDYFNSPIKQSTTINSVGGVVSWTPTMYLSEDSVVYFWRVSKDSVDATGYNWRGRSFQRIQGKEGWEQAHFFQFENDGYEFTKHNRPTRHFSFVNDLKELKATNHGKADWGELNQVAYYIAGVRKGKNAFGTPCAIHVAVLDSVTLEPWSADERNHGQDNVLGWNNGSTRNCFVFRHNLTQMAALETFIKDTVPSGNHILMWSVYIVNLSNFTDSIQPSLRNYFNTVMGAPQMETIPNLYPFILYHQKGNPASTIEVIGDSITHKGLLLTKTLVTSANYGNIFSEIMGPAVRWDSLSWRMSSLESPTTKDSTVLNVIGVNASGIETVLINNLPTDSGDIRITTQVDASLYPYLKLHAHLTDDSLLTAPQLDRWQITYEGVPEAALDPSIYFSIQNDTVDEGIDITVSIAVKNISPYNMDSLLISFAVMDKYNNIQFLPYDRQKPLLSDSVIMATITFSTVGIAGLNSLLVDVNPNNDQLEQYHFNNVAQIPFYVNADKINPILDVTFDGIHILDGDIVSPKANIVIELTDENQYLLLDDTSAYAVYISTPNGAEERIYFYSGVVERMQFVAASLPKNNSKIILQGDFPEDGKYKLRVQASDRTQNNSGNFDYIISFEVVNRSTITNIFNYPNPFTTSTRFVFTLTGSEIPEVFKIQIMTITGKVVREIHRDELGAINIGRNISDFAWDGTDTYGDRLANGLYLYHVVTKINSEDIEHRDTSADGYFKKGFGKMYLFR
ncbi:MAG: hypothetical protein COB15_14505 [Flavobacteriales bacterium]|nr:MAG: hypothetical protein COB15_14505 [Flavobacteriales bacterium]